LILAAGAWILGTYAFARERPVINRDHLFTAFFFAVFFFLIYQFYLFLSPFAAPLFLAAVLVVTFSPLTARVLGRLRGSRSLSALVMTLGVVLLVLLPLLLVLSLLVSEASQFYERVEQIRSQGGEESRAIVERFRTFWRDLQGRFPPLAAVDFSHVPLEASKRIAGWVAAEGQALATGVAIGLLNASMMLVAMFFFFRDGDRIAVLLRDLIPMEPVYRDRILKRLYDTLQVVVQSSLAIAVLQGFVAGVGYAFLGGLSVSVFLAFLTGVASFVPVVGSALIWLPAAIYVLVAAELWRGIALLLWGALAVGSVDNFVRPLMIGGRVQIPTVLLLFALLGGVQVYGMLGILVAPVVVAILIGFVEIYRERLADLEPGEAPREPG
jgi:predicted PurR-regulated permease PerM